MEEGRIIISPADLLRLRELLGAFGSHHQDLRPELKVLSRKLDQAVETARSDVPEDVVSVDSDVLLSDGRTGAVIHCSIVFPECAEAAEGRISVLAPLGVALLGHRPGERVSFDAPEGPRACEILNVQRRLESGIG